LVVGVASDGEHATTTMAAVHSSAIENLRRRTVRITAV
ncbi:MAG: hypothetical protein JWN99_2455, partial [Ilumatobacteraceae bacterium]|nr:hypothetical protein [Ilumatobacteraceae bacterium]